MKKLVTMFLAVALLLSVSVSVAYAGTKWWHPTATIHSSGGFKNAVSKSVVVNRVCVKHLTGHGKPYKWAFRAWDRNGQVYGPWSGDACVNLGSSRWQVLIDNQGHGNAKYRVSVHRPNY